MLCQSSLCCRLIMLSQIYITINKQQWIKHCVLDSVLLIKAGDDVHAEKRPLYWLKEILSFYFLHLKIVLMRSDILLCTANEPFDCSWPLWWSDQGLWTVPLSCFKPRGDHASEAVVSKLRSSFLQLQNSFPWFSFSWIFCPLALYVCRSV